MHKQALFCIFIHNLPLFYGKNANEYYSLGRNVQFVQFYSIFF